MASLYPGRFKSIYNYGISLNRNVLSLLYGFNQSYIE